MSSVAADRSVPDHSTAAGYSWRKIILTVAMLLAVAAAIYSFFPQSAWVEIIGQDVLRTSASQAQLARARDAVIAKHQNLIDLEDGKKSDPSFKQKSRGWRAGPAPKVVNVEVNRSSTKITDKDGDVIAIEEITVTDQPTLIFIECNNDSKKMTIVNELVDELGKRGVKTRMP
jgi:hypothetical protein